MFSFKHNHIVEVNIGELSVELGDNATRTADKFFGLLERLVVAIENSNKPRYNIAGGNLMFIVKADNPDVGYTIVAPVVQDSEGNTVELPNLAYEVNSTDPEVVSITPNPGDPTSGNVHFGHPGLASLNVQVKSGETVLGSFGAQFTLTAGDPATIAGGGITFSGLTETDSGTAIAPAAEPAQPAPAEPAVATPPTPETPAV